jgi:hypothetical protein
MKLGGSFVFYFLASAVACSHPPEQKQQDSAFALAIGNESTSPSFVKIQIIDLIAKRQFTTCVTANLFLGALHIEQKLPYTESGKKAAEEFAISNSEHVFSFKSPAALQNMPLHPSPSELSEAQNLVAATNPTTLSKSLEGGSLHDYYADHSRRQEHMSALACALIDRGYKPVLADMTGTLYVEQ